MHHLGMVYEELEQYEKAIDMFTKSIELKEKVSHILSQKHNLTQTQVTTHDTQIAWTLKKLANLYNRLSKKQEAIPLLQRALKVEEELEYGMIFENIQSFIRCTEPLIIASTAVNLGELSQSIGQSKDAAQAYGFECDCLFY